MQHGKVKLPATAIAQCAPGVQVVRFAVAHVQQVDANLAAAGFDAADFDAVVAAGNFRANKPAPDIFLAAAELMGVQPADCVVVEDAPSGIQAAKNAGEGVGHQAPTSVQQLSLYHDTVHACICMCYDATQLTCAQLECGCGRAFFTQNWVRLLLPAGGTTLPF